MIEQQTAAAEMVSAGQGQIAELEAQITDLQQHIEQAQTELADADQSLENQEAQLVQARMQVHRLEEEFDKIRSYALLASGTANEKRAISQCGAAKRAYETANKALEKLCRQVEEAGGSVEIRERELLNQIHFWNVDLQTRQAELLAVRRGMSRAQSELGQETFDQAQAHYHKMAAQILEVKTALIAQQVAMQEFYEQALEDLAPWPDLQKQVRGLEPPDDATWIAITATIAYMEMLTENAPHVRLGEVALPWDLRDCLYVHEEEVYNPSLLDTRLNRLRQVKEAYLEHWRTGS